MADTSLMRRKLLTQIEDLKTRLSEAERRYKSLDVVDRWDEELNSVVPAAPPPEQQQQQQQSAPSGETTAGAPEAGVESEQAEMSMSQFVFECVNDDGWTSVNGIVESTQANYEASRQAILTAIRRWEQRRRLQVAGERGNLSVRKVTRS